MSAVPVILYSRAGCHLCDDAQRLLQRYGLEPLVVDIDTDPTLRDRWNLCVPVVEIAGEVRFKGIINEVLLRRLLEKMSG